MGLFDVNKPDETTKIQTEDSVVVREIKSPSEQKQNCPDFEEKSKAQLESYKIKHVSGSKFKCFEKLEVEIPDINGIIEIIGNNGDGKTSFFEIILFTLFGLNGFDKGEAKKFVHSKTLKTGLVLKSLNHDDITIERKLTASGKHEAVIRRGDKNLTQEDLNTMISKVAFNPIHFATLSGPEQARYLGVDVEIYEQEDAKLRQDRLEAGREKKFYEKKLLGISIPENVPSEKIDITRMYEKRDKAREIIDINKTCESNNEHLKARNTSIESEISELMMKIENLKDEAIENRKRIESNNTILIKNQNENTDLDSIEEEIRFVQSQNELLATFTSQKTAYDEAKAQLDHYENLYATYDQAIKDNEAAKKKYIADFNFPFSSMQFEDGKLLIDGREIKQFSDGEKITLSAKLVSMPGSQINSIFLPNYNLLDTENRELVSKIAYEDGVQVFAEIIPETSDSTSPNAIIIREVSERISE